MRARVLGMVGAEVRADVAEPGGRQQRVDDRVRDGVAVGVPRQRGLARPLEPGEPQRRRRPRTRARRCRRRPADARIGFSRCAIDGASGCRATSDRARSRSAGVVILNASGSPLDDRDAVTGGRDEGGVVGVVPVGDRVGGVQHVAPEALRRLRRRRARRGRRRRRSARPSTRLMVSMTGRTGMAPSAPASIASTTRSNTTAGRQGARRVVHEHDLDVAPQGGEPARDGLLPRVTAGDDRHEVAPVAGRLERIGQRVALAARGRDDDDLRERAVEARRRAHDAGWCARRCRRTPSGRPQPVGCPTRPRRR